MITSRPYIATLLGLCVLSGCTREVIVRDTSAVSNSSSSSSSITTAPSTPSVTVSPINDKTILCSRAWGRSFEIWNPSDTYWKTALKSGFGSPEVSEAGDKFREAVVKTLPSFKGLIGPEAPKEVADAINAYADTADKFSDAAGAHSSEDELNPLAKSFGKAVDEFKVACGRKDT